MRDLISDCMVALRSLRKERLVLCSVVLSLALAIGGNTAVFSLIYAQLYRPFPYPDPDELIFLSHGVREFTGPHYNLGRALMSHANFIDLREATEDYLDVAALKYQRLHLGGDERAESVVAPALSRGFFETLGVQPFHGRDFAPEEWQAGRNHVALLNHSFWMRQHNGDLGVLGESLLLEGQQYRIVGVMAEGFEFISPTWEVWVPLVDANGGNRSAGEVLVMARQTQALGRRELQQRIDTASHDLRTRFPRENEHFAVYAMSFQERLSHTTSHRRMLLLLQGVLVLVLLAACANVANLLLARGEGRSAELGIRQALGAGRSQIVRLLFSESLVLATLGGGLGLLLSLSFFRIYRSASWARDIPANYLPRADGGVLLFSFGLLAIVCVLVALLPAIRDSALRPILPVARVLGRGRRSVSRTVVVLQVGFSVIVVSGALLVIDSFGRLARANAGFDADNVLSMRIQLPASRYAEWWKRLQLYEEVIERLEAVGGVESVAIANRIPRQPLNPTRYMVVEGRDYNSGDPVPEVMWLAVSDDYFETLGIELHRGRLFGSEDRLGDNSTLVALINESLAQQFWPDGDAIGSRIWIVDGTRTIVGVTENASQRAFFSAGDGIEPIVYVPHRQVPVRDMAAFVRTASSPLGIAAVARETIRRIDPELVVHDLMPLDAAIADTFARRRSHQQWLTVFAGLALFLTAIGIYGVLSQSVNRRTQEIGLRKALGATSGSVLILTSREGLLLSVLGMAWGLPGAWFLGAFIARVLSETAPVSPGRVIWVLPLALLTSLAGSALPSIRASRLSPTRALRTE